MIPFNLWHSNCRPKPTEVGRSYSTAYKMRLYHWQYMPFHCLTQVAVYGGNSKANLTIIANCIF